MLPEDENEAWRHQVGRKAMDYVGIEDLAGREAARMDAAADVIAAGIYLRRRYGQDVAIATLRAAIDQLEIDRST